MSGGAAEPSWPRPRDARISSRIGGGRADRVTAMSDLLHRVRRRARRGKAMYGLGAGAGPSRQVHCDSTPLARRRYVVSARSRRRGEGRDEREAAAVPPNLPSKLASAAAPRQGGPATRHGPRAACATRVRALRGGRVAGSPNIDPARRGAGPHGVVSPARAGPRGHLCELRHVLPRRSTKADRGISTKRGGDGRAFVRGRRAAETCAPDVVRAGGAPARPSSSFACPSSPSPRSPPTSTLDLDPDPRHLRQSNARVRCASTSRGRTAARPSGRGRRVFARTARGRRHGRPTEIAERPSSGGARSCVASPCTLDIFRKRGAELASRAWKGSRGRRVSAGSHAPSSAPPP
ncbi:hypothetical protein PsYK624_160810 [Phanerochaete sordida]|uniref:Uncharacterized protein n=1 Tax=Phanerochaete sordida TaxID=48140 RepID=A0A9P3GUJ2_9APHY|nr:hypothetical protein PsYK624_160810 [Phanerochaete sordida]